MKVVATAFVLSVLVSVAFANETGKVDGSFVVGGTDAHLKYVRATRVKLDEKGKQGYAVLLSAQPATGDIMEWKTADPAKRGSFIHILFEKTGDVWVAEFGHAKAKTGRFGVVTELRKVKFEVTGQRLTGQVTTGGEQTFTDDRYTVDLKFDVPIEP
jgi:hypothetical protein